MSRACAAVVALALLAPLPALASGFTFEGEYIMAGVDIGLTVDDDVGALFGFEASYVELDDAGPWYGLVTGVTVDSGDDSAARFVLAAEAGNLFIGAELGATIDTTGTFGGRFRALGTLGVGSIYAGIAVDGDVRGEFGILLKAPIEL